MSNFRGPITKETKINSEENINIKVSNYVIISDEYLIKIAIITVTIVRYLIS